VAQPAQLWCCSVAEILRRVPDPGARWLSPEEDQRLAGITGPRRRDQFLAGRWLVRLALAARHGGAPRDWHLSAPPDGPPRVTGGPVACTCVVRLSHSGDTLACVLSGGALGIDVERHDRRAMDAPGFADIALSDAERERWLALPETSRGVGLLAWWTLKEAWLKAHGRALNPAELRNIEALPVDARKANARLWHEADFTIALVGLEAAAPLHVASRAPCSTAQWWSVSEVSPASRAAV